MEIELAGYGYTANVKHWQHDFLLKVESSRINGKLQFVTSKQQIDEEMNRVIFHVWSFPTWEEKKKGAKAKHTYSQNLSELVGQPLGMFNSFSSHGQLTRNRYTWDNGSVRISNTRVIVLLDDTDIAHVAELAKLVTAESGDDVWRKTRIKS